ncbi:MAG TPA: phosphate signaling complex protein PhoU [Thermoanaerobaculia bacterium]|nr:phosphate signaling complex protein PhoU [Thermoanaerobaculia bacterium]
MERTFIHHLDEIRQQMLRMGGLVEEMVAGAMQALIDRDSDHAAVVIRTDLEVDALEMKIDEACNAALVRFQPAAIDLRFLVAVMKSAHDLERMGDSAVNVAEAVEVLNQEPPLKPYIDLPRLAELVRQMVKDALDAFVQRDADRAIDVCRRDDEVDALYKQLFRELLTYMMEDPKAVTRSLHLLLVARNFERIADHATNIAEDVVYYVRGEDIRHHRARTNAERRDGIV